MDRSVAQRKITNHIQKGELFGRAHDLVEIGELLTSGHHRLVTLTGPGGVGKTRLALAVSDQLGSSFANGAAFIELADISEPDQVALEIARVLAMPIRPIESITDQLLQFLTGKQKLLVLDNLEQVQESGSLIASLVTSAPDLVILTTSRSRLRLSFEREYSVAPLSTREPDNPITLSSAAEVDAVRLFVDRAKAIQKTFELTADNASHIVGICRALDGLPLAIELAAARIRVLSPAAMVARLDQRLSLLTGGARDLPLRQQAMRNAIDWSYDLLSHSEQQLFRRVSLPVGSFTLDMASALDPGNLVIVDDLESLIEKSLVIPVPQAAGASRFQLLETIRAYGLGQLEANQDLQETTRLLTGFEVDLLRNARVGWREHRDRAWVENVRLDFGTTRLVLKSAIDQGDKEAAAQLLTALDWYWEETSQYREGRKWIDLTLDLDQPLSAQSETRLLIAAGAIYFRLQEGVRATDFAARALEHARQLGDDQITSEAISIRAAVDAENGELDGAELLYIELGELSAAIGRTRGVAGAVHNLGMLAFARGDFSLAESRHQEAVARDRQAGDLMRLQNSLATLAMVKYRLGDLHAMRALLAEQLGIDPKRGLPSIVGAVSLLCAAEGRYETAAMLIGVAEAGTERIGISRFGSFVYTETFDLAIANARRELADENWTSVWNTGREMADDEVLAMVQEILAQTPVTTTLPIESPGDSLSAREREVLKLIARGGSNKQIAEALFISPATAKVHVRSIMTKLNLGSRTAAAAFAIHNGLN